MAVLLFSLITALGALVMADALTRFRYPIITEIFLVLCILLLAICVVGIISVGIATWLQ